VGWLWMCTCGVGCFHKRAVLEEPHMIWRTALARVCSGVGVDGALLLLCLCVCAFVVLGWGADSVLFALQKAHGRSKNPVLLTLPRAPVLAPTPHQHTLCDSSPPRVATFASAPASALSTSLDSAAILEQRRADLRSRVQAFALTPDQDAVAQRRLQLAGIAPQFSSDPAVIALPPERRAMVGAGGSGKWGFAAVKCGTK
jgi:hypothetical protein